jgi:hypothetical protein
MAARMAWAPQELVPLQYSCVVQHHAIALLLSQSILIEIMGVLEIIVVITS